MHHLLLAEELASLLLLHAGSQQHHPNVRARPRNLQRLGTGRAVEGRRQIQTRRPIAAEDAEGWIRKTSWVLKAIKGSLPDTSPLRDYPCLWARAIVPSFLANFSVDGD